VDTLVEDRLIISVGVVNRTSYYVPSSSRMESSALSFASSGGVVSSTGYYTPQVLFVSFVVRQSAL